MTTITIPLDLTRFSERALPVAVALATALDGAVTLMTVRPEGLDGLSDDAYLLRLASGLSVPTCRRALVTTGPVDEAILDAIGREGDADSIVCMAAHGRTRPRLVLTSVSEALVRKSTYPVALVGPGSGPPTLPIDRMIVCLDGSTTAEAALPVAADLARRLDAKLALLHVLDLPHSGHLVNGYLQTVAHRFGSIPTHTAVHTTNGASPAKVIAEHAAETGAGLIVMATHGRTGLRRAVLGSVAQGVVHRAPCPVIVVTARRATTPSDPMAASVAAGNGAMLR